MQLETAQSLDSLWHAFLTGACIEAAPAAHCRPADVLCLPATHEVLLLPSALPS